MKTTLEQRTLKPRPGSWDAATADQRGRLLFGLFATGELTGPLIQYWGKQR